MIDNEKAARQKMISHAVMLIILVVLFICFIFPYELILDCAKFWVSRLEPGEDGKLHINDVVGPDEYKERVNDNAFTNYMAWWNIGKAMEYAVQLKAEKPELYAKLDVYRVQ